jgi:hypothetical protein
MQSFYMICCERNNNKCYYAKGIYLHSIPFLDYKHIQIQKITHYNNNQFIHDLYPALNRFLKTIKLYFKLCKSPKTILNRELEGPIALPQFRKILQTVFLLHR